MEHHVQHDQRDPRRRTGARTANWSLPLTITGNRKLQLRARTVSSAGTADNTKAIKKTETFGLTDQPPNTDVTGPSSTLVKTMTFTSPARPPTTWA